MRIVLFFLLVVFVQTGTAQQPGPFSIAVNPKYGILMAHRETMHHLVKRKNKALELEFSRQDTSGSVWSQIYRNPSQGWGLNYQDYGNPEVLGSSMSIFHFIKFPIYQDKKWGFIDFRLGNGLSYITKKYDEFENKKNIAIGSHINGFVNIQFAWTRHHNQFFYGLGLDFSHISNSSFKAPNQGLNTFTPFLTLGYNVEPRQYYEGEKYPKDSLSIQKVRVFSKWNVHFIVGLKQNLPDKIEGRTYGVAAVQGLYRKQLGRVWDWEMGLDLSYNEANRWSHFVDPKPVWQTFQLGAYTGLAVSIYRTQVYFGLGAYGLNLLNPAGWVYNRIGLRYMLNEKWNLAAGIRAHVGIADYLEWGLGYRF